MRLLETDKDTICALSTAHGIGAISVIRISGIRAAEITRKIAAFLPQEPESHKIYYGILKSVDAQRPLDEVLLSFFKEGRSFTGEESIEISCHGSESVVSDILSELVVAGCRPARRGEFTYRAFMGGRLDLVQAESVLALIESRSQRASQMALRQLQGDLSQKFKSLVDRMTWILAHLEANIDYAAEDIEVAASRTLHEKLHAVYAESKEILSTYKQGRMLREGYRVALIGRPNAGKSSLLNALLEEDKAIVTPIAGTTRDFVEAEIMVDGVRVTLIDTAGLRMTDDPVEKIGVERTLAKIQEVDAVWYVADAEQSLSLEDREFFARVPWARTSVLLNKCDLNLAAAFPEEVGALRIRKVSAVARTGLDELKRELGSDLRQQLSEDTTVLSNARHFQLLQAAVESMEKSLPLVMEEESPDLIALELQAALASLYEILGVSFDDQVMDRVFKEFCLGK